MVGIIRIIGLIALFWLNKYACIFAFIALAVIQGEDWKLNGALIKNNTVRFITEQITNIMSVIGIWYFPSIPENYAHIAAVIAAVIIVALILAPLVKEKTGSF